MTRQKFHFEPKKGWINDPNGLIYYKGKYHLFFQHNPYDTKWDTMHWGHAVSDDMINWTELEMALVPNKEYENTGGCFSGSAIEKDGRLYLFYTGVSEKYGQAQCMAYSDDGYTFTKYENNPIIPNFPDDGSRDFRDPKVTLIGDTYHMVIGSGKDGVGNVLLYTSKDLYNWEYKGVLFKSKYAGESLECPDFFFLDGKYVIIYSIHKRKEPELNSHICVAIGDFDGEKFICEKEYLPEHGPAYYASQSFINKDGERVIFAWARKNRPETVDEDYFGALSAPRTLHVKDGNLLAYPIKELWPFLTDSDPLFKLTSDRAELNVDMPSAKTFTSNIKDVKILRDERIIEVFVNGGEETYTYWFK